MVQTIACPNCKQVIYSPDLQKNIVVCVKCDYRYVFESGVLEKLSFYELNNNKTHQLYQGRIRQQNFCEIRFLRSGTNRALQFQLPQGCPQMHLVPGDRLNVLYACPRNSALLLCWLKNETTGQEYRIRSPRADVRLIGRNVGGVVFLSGLVVSLGLGGLPARVVQMMSLPVAMGAGYCAHRKSRAHLQGGPENQGVFFAAEQSLLKRMEDLEQKALSCRSSCQAIQGLIHRLNGHRKTILAVNYEKYQHQLATIDRGVGVLQKKLHLSESLAHQYEYTISLLEVEIEAGRIAEELPGGEDITQQWWDELSNLEVIAQQIASLEQELSFLEVKGK